MATIPELFDSLKAYINSVIGDKITIINTKTTEAESSAAKAKTSETNAKTSENNAASAATTAVTNAVNELKGNAPAAFDTLGEIADELAANQTLHASMLNQIAGKANTSHTHTISQITNLPTIAKTEATPDTLVQRTAQGAVYVDNPVYTNHATHKGYVDAQIATRAPSSHTHSEYVAKAGSAATLWVGSQSAYDALPSATKNAAGFIAVIS